MSAMQPASNARSDGPGRKRRGMPHATGVTAEHFVDRLLQERVTGGSTSTVGFIRLPFSSPAPTP